MFKKKILCYSLLFILIMLLFLPLIISCSGDAKIDGIDSNTIINLIFPNVWVLLATLLATIILVSAIIWLVWKPFNKKMEERKAFIKKELVDAENAKLESIAEKDKIHKEYIQAQSDINKMLLNANHKATVIYDEIKSDAQKKAHIIQKNAKAEIEMQKQKLQESINDEILDVAFAAVTQISKQKITKEENDKLVNDFIDELDKVNL